MRAEDRVVRPAAVLAARAFAEVTTALESMDVGTGGVWSAGVGLWQRFARPWTNGQSSPLIGSIGVSYDTPSRHMATIFRVAVTQAGRDAGYTAEKLADEALMACGMSLSQLPRAELPNATGRRPVLQNPHLADATLRADAVVSAVVTSGESA